MTVVVDVVAELDIFVVAELDSVSEMDCTAVAFGVFGTRDSVAGVC